MKYGTWHNVEKTFPKLSSRSVPRQFIGGEGSAFPLSKKCRFFVARWLL
jgi:hypothetical protein